VQIEHQYVNKNIYPRALLEEEEEEKNRFCCHLYRHDKHLNVKHDNFLNVTLTTFCRLLHTISMFHSLYPPRVTVSCKRVRGVRIRTSFVQCNTNTPRLRLPGTKRDVRPTNKEIPSNDCGYEPGPLGDI